MKTKKFNKKLELNKESISKLSNASMKEVKGGRPKTYGCQISYDFGVCISINVACETDPIICG